MPKVSSAADIHAISTLLASFPRKVFRVQYAANGPAPGVMPPPGLFPATWREALRTDSYRVDMLVEFYGDTFGITGHDQLEDKQSKFLEWIGAVRP